VKSRWLWVSLFAALLFYLSLFPYNFDFSRSIPAPRFDWPHSDGDWIDSFLNLLAYVPLGLLARRVTGQAQAWMLGALLSALIEITQSFLPTRNPSIRDFVLNATGTALGWSAGGILQAEYDRHLSGFRALFRSRLAILAWLLWFIWQAAPLVPLLRRSQLNLLWTALTHPQLSLERIASQAIVIAFLAKITPLERWRTYTLASIGILWGGLAFRNAFDYSDLIGLVGGALLANAPWPLLATIGLAHLAYLQFHAIGQNLDSQQRFSWFPMAGFTSAPFPVLRTTVGKALLYGATVFAATKSGIHIATATILVALLLAIGEYFQQTIPGRTPEITDPLLAIAMAFLFQQLAKSPQSEPPLPPQ
jgi:VanZ family protein